MTILIDDEDRFAPANQHWELEEWERKRAAALEGVRWLARNAYENNPPNHRTGCITVILKAAAEVLEKEKGWTWLQVMDALVLEAVRAGGNLENDHKAELKAARAKK
jgi:hypothetical protein